MPLPAGGGEPCPSKKTPAEALSHTMSLGQTPPELYPQPVVPPRTRVPVLTSGTEAAVYGSGQHPRVTFPSGSHVLLMEKPGPVKNHKNGSCLELCLLDARDRAKSLIILTAPPPWGGCILSGQVRRWKR